MALTQEEINRAVSGVAFESVPYKTKNPGNFLFTSV